MCDGRGRWESGERCMQCTGFGLTEEQPDPEIWGADKVRRAPRPPAVQSGMCRDCAYRQGAPEEESPPPLDRPFYCHHGAAATQDDYTPPVMYDGMPIGEKVCAGWWRAVTGEGEDPADAAPFADTHPYEAFSDGQTQPRR